MLKTAQPNTTFKNMLFSPHLPSCQICTYPPLKLEKKPSENLKFGY